MMNKLNTILKPQDPIKRVIHVVDKLTSENFEYSCDIKYKICNLNYDSNQLSICHECYIISSIKVGGHVDIDDWLIQ